ncbi:MAG: bifunctional hydroxymethylpyrimidine kinase/phosphomethylpyrimidine kinase [Candidatus Promineifilaceae bacterium]
MTQEPAKVLTIAGSDSGGAAGLQADLKTFTTLHVYGMSVVTAVTAQNSVAVTAVHPMPPEMVAAQIDAVLSDYGAAAVKTAFIGRVDLVEVIAERLAQYRPDFVVVDPVLVNHRGEAMFSADVTQAYLDRLLPLATLVTPNKWEAALLTGKTITSREEMKTAARQLAAAGARWVLIKGWREGEQAVDLLYGVGMARWLTTPFVETENLHGSGDTLSAAVCAFLALGAGVETAVVKAHAFTAEAIRNAADWRLGAGHGPVDNLERGMMRNA